MKKILSLLLSCIMLISVVGIASAAENESIIHALAGYGIIDANEEYDMNTPVTRGEFASMVTRLMCINDAASEYTKTPYWDVPSDHKYASDIAILTSIGIMNGYSAEYFAPNDFVSYEQAIKVLILVTGYGEIALYNGGWPDGYITQASRNKMLGGVKLQNPFSRASLYRLVYNTLDVPLVDRALTTGGNKLEKTDDTLRNQIAGKTQYELYHHKGVITANSYTYTSAPYSDLYDDEVVINNKSVGGNYIYNVGNTNAFDLVGYEVEFYARKADWGYELLSVKPTNNNEVITVNSDDFGAKNGLQIKHKRNGRTETLILESDFKVIYNGTRELEPTDALFEIADGYYTFISNDSDKSIEVVMIWQYQNAIANSFDGTKIVFSNDVQYDSLTALAINTDDKEIKMIVTDKDGRKQESFDSERVVSIFANKEKNRYKIILSDEIFEGSISSMGGEICTIGDKDYKVSASLTSVRLGERYTFYVDHQGKIAFAKPVGDVNYGYVFEYGRAINARNNVEARLIIPSKVDTGETRDEETGEITDSYLSIQNQAVEYFTFAEKVRSEGSKYQGKEILDLLDREDMKVVSYKLDADGKICEITPLEKCGGDVNKRYQYDVTYQVFGGSTVDQTSGFAVNLNTVAACVPIDDNNQIDYSATEEDLNVRTHISKNNNDVGFRVEGYDFDPITKKAKFLLVHASMDATAVVSVDAFAKIAGIVTGKQYIYNEETDDYDLQIEVLQRGSTIKLTPAHNYTDNAAILSLQEGDLIVYSLNKNDLLSNVSIMQSLPALANRDYLAPTISGSAKKSLGKVGKISHDDVDTLNKCLVTTLELYTGDSDYPRIIKVKQTSTLPVYLYDSENDTYTSVSYRDIIPDSDKIFIYERNGDANIRAIVIFR